MTRKINLIIATYAGKYYKFDSVNKDVNKDKEKSKWIIRMSMNKTEMLDKNISMDDIHFGLMNSYNNLTCMYTDYNSDKLIFRIRINRNLQLLKKKKNTTQPLP